jgi:hypothetical protein
MIKKKIINIKLIYLNIYLIKIFFLFKSSVIDIDLLIHLNHLT